MNTILIVDDEAPFRAVLRDILEPLGHRVLEAGDGEEALERLGRMRVDLILADQRMPRVDGLALLRRVRLMPSPAPVILLTAHGTIPDAVDAVRAGAADYLTKPLQSPEALVSVVERALAATGGRRARAAALLGISERTLRNKLNKPPRRPA